MSEEQKSNQLSPWGRDHAATAARAFFGILPAGSLISELVVEIIPNQRMDRIAKFAEILDQKLSELEQDFVRSQLTNENCSDLFEEGMRQAARSLTDDRRNYIANLIVNSISSEGIEYIEAKHLLRMLGEINDIEIIWLRFFLHPFIEGDEEFRSKHADILEPIIGVANSPSEIHEKAALQESYKQHLAQLNLLEYRYHTDLRSGAPEFDQFTGGLRVRGHSLSSLGRLLLKSIGLNSPEI